MIRYDVKKDRWQLYRPKQGEFSEVQVPTASYLAFDGRGDPNRSQAYPLAVQSLYTAAYSVRAALKSRTGDDFVVGPLEGLWSAADPQTFVTRDKAAWDWTMLIPLPEAVSPADSDAGLAVAAGKKPEVPVSQVAIRTFSEGRCLQILHLGPYDDEGPTLARLHHEVMPAMGLTFNGRHHEIYLSDPRRVAPDKLRTILRQPVCPTS